MKLRFGLGLSVVCALLLPAHIQAQFFFLGNRPPITPFSSPFGGPGFGSYGSYGYPSPYSSFGAYPYGGVGGYYNYPATYGTFSSYRNNSLLQAMPYSGTYTYYSNLPAGTIPKMRNVPYGAYPSDAAAGSASGTTTYGAGSSTYAPFLLPALIGQHCAARHRSHRLPREWRHQNKSGQLFSGIGESTGRAVIQIDVPSPAAELWVEGQQIESFGLARRFVSPPLSSGTYQYQVRVRWTVNGQVVTQTQDVNVHAGDNLTVAFPTKG